MTFPIEAIVFLFLLATALAVTHLRDLFAAAMVFGVFSLLSAGLFTLMDAVDVAFTEAAVGAGISTVLILSTLALTDPREHQQPVRFAPVAVVLLVGAALVYGTLDMPYYGDPTAPIHKHVAPEYIEGAMTDFGIPNIVTNVLASYRGYDTLGETTVVLTATVGVMLLLGGLGGARHRGDAEVVETAGDEEPTPMDRVQVARVSTTVLAPLIMLFGLYVQFHGDFGPGGGFQAGVIFASALILHGIVFGLSSLKRVVSPRFLEIGLAAGVLIYAGTGVASLFRDGTFLDYAVLDHHSAQHGRHLGILLVEAGVGITVTCAMVLIFFFFAGRRAAKSEGPGVEHGGPGDRNRRVA
ncbi:MAG: DUF4040 domain-containing protein [Myxococcales bacterium]|nr:DUF4040 domain-containing protein [Myxococcales bacterium]